MGGGKKTPCFSDDFSGIFRDIFGYFSKRHRKAETGMKNPRSRLMGTADGQADGPEGGHEYRPSRMRMTWATAWWSQSLTMQAPASRTSGAQLAGAKAMAEALSMETSF